MNYDDVRPLTIRCDATILAKCKVIAKANRRSTNLQIAEFLAVGIANYEKINGTVVVSVEEE